MKILTIITVAILSSTIVFGGSLHDAVMKGDLGEVERLVKEGSNPHELSENGHYPITLAAINGHFEVVAFLADHADREDYLGSLADLTLTIKAMRGIQLSIKQNDSNELPRLLKAEQVEEYFKLRKE